MALPNSVSTVSDLLEWIASDDDRKEGLDFGDGRSCRKLLTDISLI